MTILLSENVKMLVILFLVMVLGYLLGSVRIKGIGLGTAGIFLVGLAFGAFGFDSPAIVQPIGLTLFMASVGFGAGPSFIRLLKQNGKAYCVLCLSIAAVGAALCLLMIKGLQVDAPLTVGIMTGSYTTSPGYAAAKDVVAADAAAVARVSVGHGIAYPVGVICKVLFIQLIPRLLHADMAAERERIAVRSDTTASVKETIRLDPWGMLPLALAILFGMLLGSVRIPLPEGSSFALGTTGGPLVAGLLLGHFGHLGKIDLTPKPEALGPVKEVGLMLFFSAAGIEGGHGLVQILAEYGFSLIVYALILVAVPLLVGFLLFRYVLKLPLLNGLGCVCASMTCTPSLAMLIEVSGTDDVAAAYATTYPIALITLILLNQFLVTL